MIFGGYYFANQQLAFTFAALHMKNKLIVILLIVSIISGNFSWLFIYASFELNQKYIAANLCENRDKPWLHCDGKCYFMKKIKQAEERDKNEERQSQKNHIQDNFAGDCTIIKFHSHLIQLINTPYHAPVPSMVNKVIFRPPQIG